MKKHNKNLKEFVILAAMALTTLLPTTTNAQTKTDGFFSNSDYETYNDRGSDFSMNGLNAWNQQFGEHIGDKPNEGPLGSGLLIMAAAGAGYVLLKKKED